MNQKNIGGALVLAFSVYWAGEAGAAPRTHDGYQFRGTVGAGFLSDSKSYDAPPFGNVSGTVSGGAGWVFRRERYRGDICGDVYWPAGAAPSAFPSSIAIKFARR